MTAHICNASAPRLLNDLYEYDIDGGYWDVFLPRRRKSQCNHVFIKLIDRSNLPFLEDQKPATDSKWSIALTCQHCRLHLDVAITFAYGTTLCPSSKDAPLHHFHFDDADLHDGDEYPRRYKFECSYSFCKAQLDVLLRKPIVKPDEIKFLSTTAKTRLQSIPADPKRGRSGHSDPLQVLSKYIQNSLDSRKDARPIPSESPVFKASLGAEMGDLLTRLGYSYDKDSNSECWWTAPNPVVHDKKTLKFDKVRQVLEDANQELQLLIMKASSTVFPPPPSRRDLEHILGCIDYDTLAPTRCNISNGQEAQYHYAVLGALPDFSDGLIHWCFGRQAYYDPTRRPLYFAALKIIADIRDSDMLGVTAMTLASEGDMTVSELEEAYRTVGIDPTHGQAITDQIILSSYRGRYPDSGPGQKENMRKALSMLGNYRGSDVLRDVARDTIETYEQALIWLGVDQGTDHEFIWAAKVSKDSAAPESKDKTTRAIEIIQQKTDSTILASRLRGDDSANQTMYPMDLDQALKAFDITLPPGQTAKQTIDPEAFVNYAMTIQGADNLDYQLRALDRLNQEMNHAVVEDIIRAHKLNNNQVVVMIPQDDPRGLRNIGNTCYLNSLLQLLFTITPVREFAKAIREDDVAKRSTQAEDSTMEGSSQAPEADALSQVTVELGKLFQDLTVTRANAVTPDTKLAEACLVQVEADIVKDSEKERRRRSTLGSMSRPAFKPSLQIPQEESGVIDLTNSPMEVDAPAQLGPPRKETDAEVEEVREITPPAQSPSPELEQSSKSPTEQRKDATDSDIMEVDDPKIQMTAKSDWNSGSTVMSPEEDFQFNFESKRSAPFKENPTKSNNANAATAITNFEAWAQQRDMREVLANAYRQIGRAYKARHAGSVDTAEANIERLISGKEKTYKVDKAGERTVIGHELSTALYITPRALAKDTHFVIEQVYGYSAVDANTHHFATLELPDILQMEITTSQDGTAEPLQVVEELLYMDRYVDDEVMITARQAYQQNKAKLETMYARREALQKTPLDMSGAELFSLASDYVDSLPDADEYFADAEDEIKDLAFQLAEIGKGFEQEIDDLGREIDKTEAIQANMFADHKEHPYRLHAVCLHHGQSNRSGHYSIYIYDAVQQVWFYYNDENVSRMINTATIFNPTLRTDARPALLVYIREGRHKDLVNTVNREPEPEPPRPDGGLPYEEATPYWYNNNQYGRKGSMTSMNAEGRTPSTEGRRSPPYFDQDLSQLEQLDGVEPSDYQREGLAISEAHKVAMQLGEDGGVDVPIPWYAAGQNHQTGSQAPIDVSGEQRLGNGEGTKKSPPKDRDVQRRASWEHGDDAPGTPGFKYKGG